MSHVAMPQALDLERHLITTGLFDYPLTPAQALLDLTSAVAGAIKQFESATGYNPFLAVSETRVFDPPGPTVRGTRYGYRARGGERFLKLDSGLVTLTSVTTGVDSSSTGTLRTLGTDFYLYPVNAPQREEPYTAIQFVSPVWGSQQSVHIAGTWGYAATVADDVWNAILGYSAYQLMPQFQHALTGGVSEYREEDEYKKFTVNPFKAQMEAWKSQWSAAVAGYVLL